MDTSHELIPMLQIRASKLAHTTNGPTAHIHPSLHWPVLSCDRFALGGSDSIVREAHQASLIIARACVHVRVCLFV